VPPIWIPNPMRFENYPEALTRQPFDLFFLNTIQCSLLSALGALLSAAVVAYGFSRVRWWGRDVLFFVCIATLMIPFQVRMIPLYLTFKELDWLNSYRPLIVPHYFGDAYYIFLLRQFFLTVPQEISDAARVDGANELSILTRIVLPLAKPALAVVALLQFMASWNDHLGPLIYLNKPNLFPIALGLQMFRGQFVDQLAWPYLMAASFVTILPVIVVFFLAQRTFVEGITITGVKG
jgi:ABC-type glycerol-3-phosphate transport system permease component